MEKESEKIVGVSYFVDKETKKLIKEFDFKNKEKENLFGLMKEINNYTAILKIIRLNGFNSANIPNYDCCILQINKNNEKIFIDV